MNSRGPWGGAKKGSGGVEGRDGLSGAGIQEGDMWELNHAKVPCYVSTFYKNPTYDRRLLSFQWDAVLCTQAELN